MERLRDKVVVLTGGAGLIGQALARAIIAEGAILVLTDIDTFRGLEAIEALKAEGYPGHADYHSLDITSKASVRGLLERVTVAHGRIDALVNNAYPRNGHYGRRLEEVEYEDFCENVSLHLGGYFLATQQFALYFRDQGFGNIVSLSSIYGVVAPRFDVYEGTGMTMPVEYAAIKSALLHLQRYFAKYFKGSPIRFNCLSPGGILNRQPEEFVTRYKIYAQSKGMLDASDLGGALVFLLSDESRYVNGQNLIVDDGWHL
ncbi:oxidoreductase [Geothrix sp. 21YS21S-4]|uniref:oxidoreductase n=1 Tax=Geothrix sp. 21YS21S-4 TaxID=3068889 RepID=UPI0027B8F6E6|nr:oxidoreductase [Geothrix sp. 21YS21S-4]